MTRDEFRLLHRLRVRWAEVDMQGIVFNGHYLTYFDVAVTEYWREIGVRYPEDLTSGGSDLFAVRSVVEYHSPARFDDLVDVGVRVARIGRSSIVFRIVIFRGDEAITSGELVYVNADPVARRSMAVPALLRDAVIRYERVAPDMAAGSGRGDSPAA